VPGNVQGFLTSFDRDDHFQNHEFEFLPPFATAQEYESAGIAFLTAPLGGAIMEGVRQNGDIVRYDSQSNEFAICDRSGILLTYFKPNPAVHRERDNIAYFKAQCLL
jgi:filamentous hemagglutinin